MKQRDPNFDHKRKLRHRMDKPSKWFHKVRRAQKVARWLHSGVLMPAKRGPAHI